MTAQAPQAQQLPAVPPPAAPAIPAALQGTDVATLRAQVGELRIQLSGLRAQWTGLKSQLDQMLRNNPARPGVQQQWADVGMQIAKTEGDIARLQARIAQQQGFPGGTTSFPSDFPGRSVNPNVAISAAAVVILVAMIMVSRLSRRMWRPRPQAAALPFDQSARLERMEQALDAIAIEVERVSEGQRFITKILADSPDTGPSTPLAIGAGPAEMIRAPERDGVRQRNITPR